MENDTVSSQETWQVDGDGISQVRDYQGGGEGRTYFLWENMVKEKVQSEEAMEHLGRNIQKKVRNMDLQVRREEEGWSYKSVSHHRGRS